MGYIEEQEERGGVVVVGGFEMSAGVSEMGGDNNVGKPDFFTA